MKPSRPIQILSLTALLLGLGAVFHQTSLPPTAFPPAPSLAEKLRQTATGVSTHLDASAVSSKFLDPAAVAARARKARETVSHRPASEARQRIAADIMQGLGALAATGTSRPKTRLRGRLAGIRQDSVNPHQQQAIDWLRLQVGTELELGLDPAEGTVRHLRGDLARIVQDLPEYQSARVAGDHLGMSLVTLDALAGVLDLPNPSSSFEPREVLRDELGMAHVKLDQRWQGLPVFGGQIVVHFNPDDEPVQVNGVYAPLPARPPASQTTISPAAALAAAVAKVGASDTALIEPTVQELVYWYPRQTRPIVAFKVDLNPGPTESWQVFVSAADGRVLRVLSSLKAGAEVGAAPDLHGASRTVNCWKDGVTYYACDTSQPMYDRNRSQPVTLRNIFGAICVLDVQQQNIQEAINQGTVVWATSSSLNTWDPATVSMISSLGTIYNYYRTVHNHNSIDGNACTIISYIHARFPAGNQLSSDNAFYNSALNSFIFGDGDQTFRNLPGALDVITHEFTHGVNHHLAGLVYQNQSGALDEHISDFMGCMVDRDEWFAGDGIVRDPKFVALRDLRDPHNPQVQSPLPKVMAEYRNLPADQDNGGVHINCGIPNYASYLMTDGPQGMGRDKAERVVYRALKQGYLTSNSQFTDYRRALVQSAKDLFPDGDEAAVVRQAFDAVAITDGQPTPPPSPTEPGTGIDLALFLSADYDFFGDFLGYALYLLTPNDFAPVASRYVTETRPAISGDGEWALYVGDDNDLYWTDGETEERLTTSGDVRTIAMTKDTRFIAFTTTDFDNTITLIDLSTEQARTATLQVPTDAEEVPAHLDFADVMTFNSPGDLLIFDAFASSGSGNSQIGFWGTYSLRVQDLAVLTVFPARQALQVGNPSLANTLGYLFLADYIATQPGTTNIGAVVVDLLNANVGQLGSGLSVFAQPTFTGDDTRILYRIYQNGTFYLNQSTLTPDKMSIAANSETQLLWSFDPLAYPVGFRQGTYVPPVGKCELLGAGSAPNYRIDFGSVPVGNTLSRTLILTNTGTADFQLLRLQVEAADGPAFSHDGINQTIPVGRALPVNVRLQPTRQGSLTASFRIQTAIPGSADLVVPLAGTGTAAPTTDSDGDGMLDWQEQIAGTDPNNPSSVFKILAPAAASPGILIEWSSVVGKNYTLDRSLNLQANPPFSVLRSNIPGQPGKTSFQDTNATGPGPYFYRVTVQ